MASFLEENINWILDGNESLDDYRKKVSSSNYIKGIKIPTFIYFSLDDPLISTNSIDFEGLKSNPNIIFGYTEYGSHLSTFSSLCCKDQWMVQLGLNFINEIKNQKEK
jgi:predicted alpha/beta-fold hydrolase